LQNLIKFLIGLSIVTAVLLALVIIAVLIHYFRTRAKAEQLLQSGKRDGSFVYELLKTSFPSGRLFRQVLLPDIQPDGTAKRIPCDLLLVDQGGVFVIRVKNLSGAVDNADKQVWTVKNQNGILEMRNPFEQNLYGVKALETILKREGVYNVPLYNLVVFSGKKVVFRVRSEKLLTAERLIETIRDMNRNKFLNAGEMAATVNAIRRYLPNPNKAKPADPAPQQQA